MPAWRRRARWLALLAPLEWLYRALVHLRRGCYRRGVFEVHRLPVPVVVVGNLTPGGTGKTAVVMALLEQLADAGYRAGVVSRGYGADGTVTDPLLVRPDSDPATCGDEPLMIHRRTGAPVAVCADRTRAAQALLAAHELDVVLSDDGLQHYALARDLEIVLYDAVNAFGNGRCLPAGPLREPLARLAEADFVLARGSDTGPQDVAYSLAGIVHLHTGERLPLDAATLGSAPVAVAGLADPALFLQMLRDHGIEPAARLFPDHHRYRAADFAGLEQRTILMTEKDAVKCRSLAPANSWYAPLRVALPPGLVDAVIALASSPARESN